MESCTVNIPMEYVSTHQPHYTLFMPLPLTPHTHMQDQEVFMDTLNTPTIRKKLKRLSAQDPGESRRRWQHVTEALRRQDIEAATEAKHTVRTGTVSNGAVKSLLTARVPL